MLYFLQKDKLHRLLLLSVGVWVALLGVKALEIPPGADTDPCWGFIVMHGMEHGNHFNQLITPNPNNIATNQAEFLSWWSPGQYEIPYFFQKLFKIDTGHAVSLTISLCGLIGLAGFYKLFRRFGFTPWVAAISVAFIATQLFFLLPFVYYTGGEVLLFAFIGWFLYGCFSFEKVTWQLLVFLFFWIFIGFFSKSSVLWMCAAAVGCVWINISIGETIALQMAPGSRWWDAKGKIWAKNALLLAVPFAGAILIIYVFYLSKGDIPLVSKEKLLLRPETVGFPLASPFLALFSIDEFVDGLIYQPDGPKISYHMAIVVLSALSFLSLVFVAILTRFSPGRKYVTAIIIFYAVAVVFFTYLFLKQSAISFEGRHFRIIGLLAMPGIVYLLFKTKITRAIFFIGWIIFAWMGVTYVGHEFEANRRASHGNTGISQQLYDDQTMKAIIGLDRAHHNDAIFVVMSSDIGAEIENNRVITIETEDMTDQQLSKLKYIGKAGPLYIIIPEEYIANGKKSKIIGSFTDYRNFKFKLLSPDYYLYFANN